ncbi:PadR family transcriptional regulator [Lactococcus kimchii]|uniref:PadR family transcriptional regulator n=1 Tax=Lactococcus sp. S-13 TaxID=2507158 RepID=UPI001022D90B|nr:PadR family transcriptional regulator [Lactococcus sp. S-13]RZI49705.1 PadR family transcriptional regulator [Lactococcus sp. S-13]
MAEIPKEMLRAQTNVIVLNILEAGDNYVYGIIKQVRDASNGAFEINEATLYTTFHRLEKDGIISSYWGDESQGGRRKYYCLTKLGREKLQLAFESWAKVDQIIENIKAQKEGLDSKKD